MSFAFICDIQSGFSEHNQIKIAIRNRIYPEIVDNLLAIKEEGGDLSDSEFQAALNHTENCFCSQLTIVRLVGGADKHLHFHSF